MEVEVAADGGHELPADWMAATTVVALPGSGDTRMVVPHATPSEPTAVYVKPR